MNKLEIIQQGESLGFDFSLEDSESVDGWTCTISVKEKPGDAAIFSRVVAASGNSWPGYLTNTETSALPVLAKGAAYYLIADKVNTATDEKQIEVVRFKISTPWA